MSRIQDHQNSLVRGNWGKTILKSTTGTEACPAGPCCVGFATMAIALLVELFTWGFTVDDAWIVARVAEHGSKTGIFSYNSGATATDAITPLGYAHLIELLGTWARAQSAWEFWQFSRYFGLVAYGLSFFLAGFFSAKARGGAGGTWLTPLLAAFCLPAALWAGAGLATPIVGLFVLTGAVLLDKGTPHKKNAGSLILGCASAWRPELIPFTAALLVVTGLQRKDKWLTIGSRLGLCLIPFLSLALTRYLKFGHILPLSFSAKQPAALFGLRYAVVTVIWGGLPWLLFSPTSKKKEALRWVGVWSVHLLALIYAGGDWMPALRLSAPLYPWLLWRLSGSLLLNFRTYLLALPALAGPILLYSFQGDDLRQVADRRAQLVRDAVKPLLNAGNVAGVDIGWLGLATPATIVDLAGVTDRSIALLPGGHTSKFISTGLFSARNVDTWVIRADDRKYSPGEDLNTILASYFVDARLLARSSDLGFVGVHTIALSGTKGQYVIARRVDRSAVPH